MPENPQIALEPEQDVEQMCALFGIKPEDFIAEINYRQQVKFAKAMKIQRLAAKVQGERHTISVGNSGGEVTQQIHPVLYHALRRRYGPEALNDPEFIRDLLKNHPELRVKSRSERLTIVRPEFGAKSTPRRGVHGRRGRWAA